MQALAQYEAELCPHCGWPRSVCGDPAIEGQIEVPAPTRCHVTTALRIRQAPYQGGKTAHPDALLWGARIRDPQPPGLS